MTAVNGAERALRESEEQVRLLLDSTGEAIYGVDLEGRCTFCNAATLRLLGYAEAGDLLGRVMHRLMHHTRADGTPYPLEECRIYRAFHQGEGAHVEDEVLWRADGTSFPAEYWSYPVRRGGEVVGAVVTIVDITERRRAEEALRDSEARFRLLVENAADPFFLHEADGRFVDVNQRACDSLGYARDELLGMGVGDVEVAIPFVRVAERLNRLAPGETATFQGVHRRRDRSTFPVEVRSVAIRRGDRPLFIALARDVTERMQAAEQLEYQASHDALTGLPNRARFCDRLEAAVAEARDRGGPVALLLIDLDRFKEINDTFGHHYGDAVLQRLNPRLRKAVRETDLVARLGGDEFAVLLPEACREVAAGVAARILAALRPEIEVDGHRLQVGGSIGVAIYPDHGLDPRTLLQQADVAMYAAKRAHSGFEFFAAGQSAYTPRRMALIADLRQGIEGGQLRLHYQPKVVLGTGRVCGAEALVRWQHPREGLVPPDQFIPLAEQTGMIRPLGRWALEAAVRQCAGWHAAGCDLSVAVNLAADNLQDPELCAALAGLLAETGVPSDRLVVEVTESVMMADPARARTVLGRLHELGVRVSIDDFGTGYSSLAYLKDLPVDEVKIDRAFVKDMATEQRSACITRAVIDLGHNLGLHVVAEGVEDRRSRDLLARWGCDQAQGFYFGRPVPPEEFLARVVRRWTPCPPEAPATGTLVRPSPHA